VPRRTGALAFCECHVVENVTAGTHRVFLASVTRAVDRDGFPLTYFRGRFGRFETEEDRTVHSELRRRILVRSISLDDSLDLQALAAEFNVLLPESGGRLAAAGGRAQSGSTPGFSPGRLRPCSTGTPLVV
jgi:hypothetical protein